MIEFDSGRYAIDDHGRVFSLINNRGNSRQTPKLLKTQVTANGYIGISLALQSGRKFCLVHRLVANAYLAICPTKPEVNHIDGNKANNHISNLEWCSRSENIDHAKKLKLYKSPKAGTGRFNEDHPNSRPVLQFGLDGKFVKEFPSLHEAGRAGFHTGNICSVLKGRYKSSGGFKWEYKHDCHAK